MSNEDSNNNNNNTTTEPVTANPTENNNSNNNSPNPDSVPNPNLQNVQPSPVPAHQPAVDLNNVIADLNAVSKVCSEKVIEYTDLPAIFKQIAQVNNNLAIVLSTYLEQRGELDTTRFRITRAGAGGGGGNPNQMQQQRQQP